MWQMRTNSKLGSMYRYIKQFEQSRLNMQPCNLESKTYH